MALTYTAEGEGSAILASMREKLTAAGGKFNGDEAAGTFSVKGFGGEYRVEDGKLTLTITDKPVFVPDSMIESWLRQHLA